VSLVSPWRLVMIVAPIALAIGYVIAQRTRRSYAARFSSVDLLASVLPKRSGWQRHLAPAALGACLVLLVLAVAHPVHIARVPRQRGTVILALDTSGSMGASDVTPTRLAAAQQAAKRFINGLPSGLQVGLLSFDDNARMLAAPTAQHVTVLDAVDRLQLGHGTATADAIQLALNAIAAQPAAADGTTAPAAIVLMSDGVPSVGRDGQSPIDAVNTATAAAKAAHIPIDTIAFGTKDGTLLDRGQIVAVPADPQTMADIASSSGGRTFYAESGNELQGVYSQIQRVVGSDAVRQDLTIWFVGAALVAALLAGVATLIWSQRVAR